MMHDSQNNFLFIVSVWFSDILISLPCLVKGQAVHDLPQFVITFLVGVWVVGHFGLILACLLKPVKGEVLENSFRYWS